MGYTTTVAAFTIVGATQDSINVMNVNFCTNGILTNTHISAHAPGVTNATTIEAIQNAKISFFLKKKCFISFISFHSTYLE